MSKEIQIKQFDDIVAEPEEAIKHFKKVQDLKRKILDKSDVVKIGGKEFVKRSGWQKFSWAFGLSDKIISEERKEYPGYFVQRIWVEVSTKGGRTVVGDGSCASNERNFAHLEHDVYATAHTRSLNRAISNIVGLGEVSAEEIDMIPQQKVEEDVYCSCTIPKPGTNGICLTCKKLDKKYVDQQKAKLR